MNTYELYQDDWEQFAERNKVEINPKDINTSNPMACPVVDKLDCFKNVSECRCRSTIDILFS